MPVNFQPSRILVEYHSQFLLVSSEIRTIGLGSSASIGVGIDAYWCLILAQNSQLHTH